MSPAESKLGSDWKASKGSSRGASHFTLYSRIFLIDMTKPGTILIRLPSHLECSLGPFLLDFLAIRNVTSCYNCDTYS